MHRLVVVFLLVVAVSGCAPRRGPNLTPVGSELTRRTGADTTALPTAERSWALPPGASLDDGLSLDEAVATALWNNPDFGEALASMDLARADLLEAGLLKNPILSLLFPVGPKQFEAAVNWSIDALWQRPRRVAHAQLNAEASAQRLVSSGLRLIADVKVAYLDAVAADRFAAVAAAQAANAGQMATLADARLRAGDVSELEARLSTLDATRVRASAVTRNAERDRALGRLGALLGMPAGAAPVRPQVTDAVTAACGDSATSLAKLALAARPDVRAAELGVEAAGERAGLERAKVLTLTATLDMNGQGREGFEAGPGVAVELPIFSQNSGGRARAAAELRVAMRHYTAVSAAVLREIEAAFVTFEEARSIQGLYGTDFTASLDREQQQLARLYEAGEISLLGLLEARQRLSEIELARQDVGLAAERARVRLEQAIGQRCPTN